MRKREQEGLAAQKQRAFEEAEAAANRADQDWMVAKMEGATGAEIRRLWYQRRARMRELRAAERANDPRPRVCPSTYADAVQREVEVWYRNAMIGRIAPAPGGFRIIADAGGRTYWLRRDAVLELVRRAEGGRS